MSDTHINKKQVKYYSTIGTVSVELTFDYQISFGLVQFFFDIRSKCSPNWNFLIQAPTRTSQSIGLWSPTRWDKLICYMVHPQAREPRQCGSSMIFLFLGPEPLYRSGTTTSFLSIRRHSRSNFYPSRANKVYERADDRSRSAICRTTYLSARITETKWRVANENAREQFWFLG